MINSLQYEKELRDNFPAWFNSKLKEGIRDNQKMIVVQRFLCEVDVCYIHSLGFDVLECNYESLNDERHMKKLKRTGALFNHSLYINMMDGQYFYVVSPSRDRFAALTIQKMWRRRNSARDVERTRSDEGKEGKEGGWDETGWESDGGSSNEGSGDGYTSDFETDSTEQRRPYISKCHVESMRCKNCWENSQDEGMRPCWYEDVRQHTKEACDAYDHYLRIDTVNSASPPGLLGSVKAERRDAHREFIQKIGGRTPEKLVALKIANEVIYEVCEKIEEMSIDSDEALFARLNELEEREKRGGGKDGSEGGGGDGGEDSSGWDDYASEDEGGGERTSPDNADPPPVTTMDRDSPPAAAGDGDAWTNRRISWVDSIFRQAGY